MHVIYAEVITGVAPDYLTIFLDSLVSVISYVLYIMFFCVLR